MHIKITGVIHRPPYSTHNCDIYSRGSHTQKKLNFLDSLSLPSLSSTSSLSICFLISLNPPHHHHRRVWPPSSPSPTSCNPSPNHNPFFSIPSVRPSPPTFWFDCLRSKTTTTTTVWDLLLFLLLRFISAYSVVPSYVLLSSLQPSTSRPPFSSSFSFLSCLFYYY